MKKQTQFHPAIAPVLRSRFGGEGFAKANSNPASAHSQGQAQMLEFLMQKNSLADKSRPKSPLTGLKTRKYASYRKNPKNLLKNTCKNSPYVYNIKREAIGLFFLYVLV